MRKLLYIPIIHTESDMGSLAGDIARQSSHLCGEKRWTKHREAVSNFWRAIEAYLASLDAADLKIYQDGLPADGEIGRKIVEESAKRGSANHQILLLLMNRGAEIRRTEDISLLLEEYAQLNNAIKARSGGRQMPGTAYQQQKERLTRERDQFIARRINESLRPGETAVLFIGAYHDVLRHLASDIVVKPAKEPDKIRAYFQELLAGSDDDRFEELAQYLASPVQDDG